MTGHDASQPSARGRRFDGALAVALVAAAAVSLCMRTLALGHLPGINGDEAWHGVQILELARGHASLRTPQGNLLDPFHTLPILLLHLIFAPAFWILRAPAWLAGVLLPPLAWLLLRRPLGPVAAGVTAFLACVLPVLVVYSRFGWYPSQSPLAALVALAFALHDRPWGVTLAFAGALLVHPTNVLLAPLLLVVMGTHLLAGGAAAPGRWRRFGVAAGGLLACAIALRLLVPRARVPAASHLLAQGADPHTWLAFATGVDRLLSGVTSYRYVAGPVSPGAAALHDVAFACICLPVLVAGSWRLWQGRRWLPLSLVGGTAVSLLAACLLAGPHPLQPHFERYALWMVVPVLASFSTCAAALATSRARQRVLWVGCLALGAALLLGLQRHYFGPLRETGGSSHLTFRTAAVEPKQQVLERALAGVPPGARLSLLAEDWWLYWPLRYLAAARPQVSVDLLHVPVAAGALRSRLARGSLVVAFRGASLSRALEASAERGEPLERWSVSDAAGRPLIDVWWAPRAPP